MPGLKGWESPGQSGVTESMRGRVSEGSCHPVPEDLSHQAVVMVMDAVSGSTNASKGKHEVVPELWDDQSTLITNAVELC